MAFGTGHHATTYMMIEQMREVDAAAGGLEHIIIVENWFEELKRLVPTGEDRTN